MREKRFLRFLILGAAAYGVWRFTYDRAGIQRAFNHAQPAIHALYQNLGFNISHSKLLPFIQHSFTHTSRWLTLLAIGLAVYALIELAESAGLWLAKRWGEYLAMVATSIFLPWEIWELARGHVTWLKVAAFAINLLLVIYLAWARRLFGVRGGKAAYEARLRTESVIEVEQAALAAKPANAAVQVAADAPMSTSTSKTSTAASLPGPPPRTARGGCARQGSPTRTATKCESDRRSGKRH